MFRTLLIYVRQDYPLPPDGEATEVLRVVVRESMCLDLLDRLVSDLCAATEYLLSTGNEIDLSTWQPFVGKSLEKEHASLGVHKLDDEKPERPMEDGIHRATC
jgi:glutamate decarboxylase